VKIDEARSLIDGKIRLAASRIGRPLKTTARITAFTPLPQILLVASTILQSVFMEMYKYSYIADRNHRDMQRKLCDAVISNRHNYVPYIT
jgi:hypothetical protein